MNINRISELIQGSAMPLRRQVRTGEKEQPG
jgi:hypothetical protein